MRIYAKISQNSQHKVSFRTNSCLSPAVESAQKKSQLIRTGVNKVYMVHGYFVLPTHCPEVIHLKVAMYSMCFFEGNFKPSCERK